MKTQWGRQGRCSERTRGEQTVQHGAAHPDSGRWPFPETATVLREAKFLCSGGGHIPEGFTLRASFLSAKNLFWRWRCRAGEGTGSASPGPALTSEGGKVVRAHVGGREGPPARARVTTVQARGAWEGLGSAGPRAAQSRRSRGRDPGDAVVAPRPWHTRPRRTAPAAVWGWLMISRENVTLGRAHLPEARGR